MPKLNDTQTILLLSAAQREGGSLYPLSEKLKPGARVTKAIAALLASEFIEERETNVTTDAYRSDGDLQFGTYAAPVGLAAIGVADAGMDLDAPTAATSATGSSRSTKSGEVLALLQRDTDATLAELIAATGWLPHTTRAALTGLRKKGHAVERSKRGDEGAVRPMRTRLSRMQVGL